MNADSSACYSACVSSADRTRRRFLAGCMACTVTCLAGSHGTAQAPVTRPNLAVLDRPRILAAAARALGRTAGDLAAFTLDLPALAAAAQIDPAQAAACVQHAEELLQRWLLAPGTRLEPAPALTAPAQLADRAGLAEVMVALPFLALPEAVLASLSAWCRQSLAWLTSDRTTLLARDARDHVASVWLLLAAACARFLGDEAVLAECRHRFQSVTLRAQIAATGFFPHELTGAAPFRDSLFNLDLLAGAVELLSTRFDSLWDRELQDGPGMRVAIARHAQYIAAPRTWPYPADSAHFHALPGRRPALLFAARAYGQAEYVTLWRTLDPDPVEPEVLATFPIRQPILWLTQPRRVSSEP